MPLVQSRIAEQLGVEPESIGLAGDQPAAFARITDLLRSNTRLIKLCGYAGSGKTHLLAKVASWALRTGLETTVVAPTHKAAGVIARKIPSGIEVRTIHSMLGLRLEPDFENDTGGRVLCANEDAKKNLRGLVICDEASMVGSVLKEHIDRTPDVAWMFVGDLAQLPPVGEGVSELLNDPDCVLEQVLRQAQGSEILNLATRIRKGDQSMDFEQGKDVFEVASAEDLFQAALAKFDTPEYQKDPTYARMLVFRNDRRKAINARMRELLVDSEDPYAPGEWLVMYAAFSPEKSRLNVLAEQARQLRKGVDRDYGRTWKRFFDYKESLGRNVTQLHTSEEVLVHRATESEVKIGSDSFAVWSLDVGARGTTFTLPVLKPEEVQRVEALKAEVMSKAHEVRKQRDEQKPGSYQWGELDQQRKRLWATYFTLEETFAQVDYSYCMTTHKSQGSTFTHAFIDTPDLLSSGGMRQRILYTACTRPSTSLTFYR